MATGQGIPSSTSLCLFEHFLRPYEQSSTQIDCWARFGCRREFTNHLPGRVNTEEQAVVLGSLTCIWRRKGVCNYIAERIPRTLKNTIEIQLRCANTIASLSKNSIVNSFFLGLARVEIAANA